MSNRTFLFLIAILALSLVPLGLWAAEVAKQERASRVISGEDLGIRLEGKQSGVMLGTLVVRVDGQWVQVQLAPKLTHAKP
jgi:hypothetical protein